MTRRSGGAKRSSQQTFRRRLLLVRRLLRGPADAAALIGEARGALGDEAYPPAAEAALKHDLDALRAEYGCRIAHRRAQGGYALEELGDLALLDLPEPAMEALAFLDASFPAGAALPELTSVRALLDQIVRLLPAPRQEQHRGRRAHAQLRMPGGAGRADPATARVVRRAIEQRRELEFSYLGPHDLDGPRRHRVAPYAIYFRPEGHAYLDATLLAASPPGGEPHHGAIDYRLDRIVPGSARALPAMLPPERPRPRSYALAYTLHPNVARRRDVATYFPDTHIRYGDDGAAHVTATITNLWQARQILLRYGDACRVTQPPELVELFRRTAEGLGKTYLS